MKVIEVEDVRDALKAASRDKLPTLKACTGLDWPSLMATASSVPRVAAGSEPAQPAGAAAFGSQTIVSTCGTPSVN